MITIILLSGLRFIAAKFRLYVNLRLFMYCPSYLGGFPNVRIWATTLSFQLLMLIQESVFLQGFTKYAICILENLDKALTIF